MTKTKAFIHSINSLKELEMPPTYIIKKKIKAHNPLEAMAREKEAKTVGVWTEDEEEEEEETEVQGFEWAEIKKKTK